MFRHFARQLSNKIIKTPLPIYAVGGAAYLLHNKSASLIEEKQSKVGSFKVSFNQLSEGYQLMSKRSDALKTEAKIAGIVCPGLAGIWLLVTSRALASSPVAMAFLLTGGLVAGEHSVQAWRINKFIKSNVILHPETVSSSVTDDSKLHQIIAGNHPNIAIDSDGMTVTGPLGDVGAPSTLRQETLNYIKNNNTFVLPHAVLNPWMQKSTELVYDRWLARLLVPISILNLIAIAFQDPEERNADDYVVGVSSAYNLLNYFNGPFVPEVRANITSELLEAKSTDELIKKLVERKILKGGMNFLEDWVSDEPTIGVRVSRTGSLVLHKSRMFSLGGPYPLKRFPAQENNETHPTKMTESVNRGPL